MENKTKPFVTIREAVKITGLSENYLRNLNRDHKLPCIMSGNRTLVDIPAFLDMMHKMSTEKIDH